MVYVADRGNDQTQIGLEEFDASGSTVELVMIESDATGTNIFRNPGIEVGLATSAFIICEHVNVVSDADANGVNLVSVTYNLDTNRLGIPNIFSFGS